MSQTTVSVVVAAIIERDGRLLLTRRLPGTHLEGHWEFPGGKVDPGESFDESLIREVREELEVELVVGEEIFSTTYSYPDRSVELHFFRCALIGEPRPLLGQELRWVSRDALAGLRLPPAVAELVQRLR